MPASTSTVSSVSLPSSSTLSAPRSPGISAESTMVTSSAATFWSIIVE